MYICACYKAEWLFPSSQDIARVYTHLLWPMQWAVDNCSGLWREGLIGVGCGEKGLKEYCLSFQS